MSALVCFCFCGGLAAAAGAFGQWSRKSATQPGRVGCTTATPAGRENEAMCRCIIINVQPQWLKLPSNQDQGEVLAFAQSSLVPVPQEDQDAELERRVPRAAVAELLWSQKAQLESCQDRQLSLSIIRRDAEEVLVAPLAPRQRVGKFASLGSRGA